MNEVPNKELNMQLIPDPEGDLMRWKRFAHTINGYKMMGGFKACADVANSGSASTLTELRCSLFFEARRDRYSSGMTFREEVIRRLLRSIIQKLRDGDLD